MEWNTALVTGASAGIGREFAEQLAGRGVALVLVARSADRLRDVADRLRDRHGVRVEVLSADLTADAGVTRVISRLRDPRRPVDLLVNNAGIGTLGPLADLPLRREERIVGLNVLAVLRLSRVAAEQMRARGRGTILNTASLAAYAPIPFFAAYGASKAFVLSLSLGLREELRGTGVSTTVLCPGFVDTDFGDKAGFRNPPLRWLYADPKRVVRDGLRGAERGRAIVLPGWAVRLASAMSRLGPPALVARGAGLAVRPLGGGGLRQAARNAAAAPTGPPEEERIDLVELGDDPVHG